ncbi:helix-turn-helix domain-containing protein [Flavobacterium sp.]|uniref:helix-turn-helix domain-containing protein n=1 Tax=Flavobacterium sp. TaxID=239 RepID=UPI00260BB5E5|nr:helix-turn-helix domain-containing protein [Flavobacterium sp.]MDD2986185.1 helix-turn-helix domain-containing protein [Flavobacterium sp.]
MLNNSIILQNLTEEQLVKLISQVFTEQLKEFKKDFEQTPENDLLTRDEVCKMLNFNKTSLWKHTKSGRLKSYGIGNRVLYKRSEVLEAVKPLNH